MSKKEILSLIAENPSMLVTIRALRDGPLKETTLKKFLTVKLKGKKLSISQLMNNLEEKKIIGSFLHLDDNSKYLILVKDIYSLRIPPKSVLNLLNKSSIPKDIIKLYKKQLDAFFKLYSNSKNLGDDSIPLRIFSNADYLSIVNILKENIISLKDTVNTFAGITQNYQKALNELEKMDVISIIKESVKPQRGWMFLKTDFELNAFFPEYLIKNISEKLKKSLIDKNLALKALYSLKYFYLKNEDPEKFEKITQEIKDLEEKISKDASLTPETKAKIIKKIVKLYDEIGEIENKRKWENLFEKLTLDEK